MKVYPQGMLPVSGRGSRPIVGYGDLVRLFASLPSSSVGGVGTGDRGATVPLDVTADVTAERLALARSLGFVYSPTGPANSSTITEFPGRTDEPESGVPEQRRPENPDGPRQLTDGWPDLRQPTVLWQVQSQTRVAAYGGDHAGHGPAGAERAELKWRGQPQQPLPRRPLAPWSVVETRLRRMLTGEATGRELDVPAVSRWLAELHVDRPSPRRAVRRWGCDVQVLVDSSEHLQPYFDDQQMVLDRLQKLLGLRNEQVFFGTDPGTTPDRSDFCCWRSDTERVSWRTPPAGTRMLILGDLGVLGRQRPEVSRRWWQLGQHLARRQCLGMALLPCNLQTLAERLAEHPEVGRGLRQAFQINSWAAEQPGPRDFEARQQLVDRIARCLCYAIRIEPQLLRHVRLLLPLAGDPGLEADVWQHPLLIGHSSVAATPQAGPLAETLLAQFEREPESVRRAVLSVWRACRSHTAPEIYLEELGRLTRESIALCPADDYDDAIAAWRYFERLAGAADNPGTNPYVQYAGRAIQRAVGDLNVNSPVAMLIGKIRNHLRNEKGQQVQQAGDWIDVYQSGRHLVFQSVDVSQPEPERLPRHSWLATVRCRGDAVRILSDAGNFQTTLHVPLGMPRECRLPDARALEIRTDTEHLQLGRIAIPSWATSFGRDTFGLWAETQVRNVRVRWRWIPPGEFEMGSRGDEPGRYDNEGPRHWVRLTRGYWMMETACTQLFWESVLGKESNRSRFQDPMRPVEKVSWADVEGFVKGLEVLVPGLGVSLPTEAQWEYACRAGSTGALYRVAGCRVGESPPELGELAWYSKNSGGQTHPVGQKLANAWGLYDMLGNVLEWCLDGQRDYGSEMVVDPVGASVESRVIRGGSWHSAQSARCAFRDQFSPEIRNNGLGFRLVRVQD